MTSPKKQKILDEMKKVQDTLDRQNKMGLLMLLYRLEEALELMRLRRILKAEEEFTEDQTDK